MNVEVAVDCGALLGESPLWSPTEQVLYWIDIEGRSVHRYNPSTGIDEEKPLTGRPGSVVLAEEPGTFLLGAELQVGRFTWEEGEFTPLLDLEKAGNGNRLNDGRTDRSGRYWVGSMYHDTSAALATGKLHRIGAGPTATVMRESIGVSNGIAFSPDGRTMYFADSPREMVWKYDYDPDTGEPSNEEPFVDFSDLPGRPDGASVDAAGCYWVACVYGWAVARISPAGNLDRLIEVPVEKPSMPAFGGPQLDTLYVTSISYNSDPNADQPLAGAVLALSPDTTGIAETPFVEHLGVGGA